MFIMPLRYSQCITKWNHCMLNLAHLFNWLSPSLKFFITIFSKLKDQDNFVGISPISLASFQMFYHHLSTAVTVILEWCYFILSEMVLLTTQCSQFRHNHNWLETAKRSTTNWSQVTLYAACTGKFLAIETFAESSHATGCSNSSKSLCNQSYKQETGSKWANNLSENEVSFFHKLAQKQQLQQHPLGNRSMATKNNVKEIQKRHKCYQSIATLSVHNKYKNKSTANCATLSHKHVHKLHDEVLHTASRETKKLRNATENLRAK